MAQSSSYKQYNRTTRVLTEESGFSGGMMWTGNNIDETHLKAIVNCDYDDTTGYLKTRDPFIKDDEYSPTEYNLIKKEYKDNDSIVRTLVAPNIKNYTLLGTYNICAFDTTNDDGLLDAGRLYIFTNNTNTAADGSFNTSISDSNILCIYNIDGEFHRCTVDVVNNTKLRNINTTNLLTTYENQLYGLGSNNTDEAWLHIYRIERAAESNYIFKQLPFNEKNNPKSIKPKIDSVTLLEACTSGFNAARGSHIFTYDSNVVDSSEARSILGVYMTDADDNIVVSPRVGQEVIIHVPVGYVGTDDEKSAVHYLAMFQLKESGDSTVVNAEDVWSVVETTPTPIEATFNNTGGVHGAFEFTFKFQKKNTTLAFTYYGTTKPEGTPKVYDENAVDYFMPYVVTTGDNSSNLKLKHYDLSTSNGSCIWRNRLCVWGTKGNNNCLFFSEVDNFYYYPVPHNVAVFDTNVMSCIPYKDTLLVFTADKIYRVSENNDGSFTQTVVQNNMPLSTADTAYLTAIKNMVLFKSGNYFYMIVPKSQSLTDELSIAPIYKNIAGFLNNIDKSVQEVLQLLYPEFLFRYLKSADSDTMLGPISSTLSNIYVEQDTVHILYDITARIKPDNTEKYFKMFLNYNTNLRAWTLYFEDTTTESLEVATLTTSQAMTFVRRSLRNSEADTPEDERVLEHLFTVVKQAPSSNPDDGFRVLLDTGYRTLSTAMQKRFREVQLKLYSASENITPFGTAFLVDGVWRRNYAKLQEVFTADNVVSLTPALDLNTFITELSMPVDEAGNIAKDPGSDAIELSDWTLDFSHFKREAPITIRVPVSGKGFNPRFIFMAPNAVGITINEINWVYRLMHGR